MAEKVTKTVEIELTTNQDKLKSGVADANKTLSDLKATQAKGNKQTDREQVKRDRDEKFKQRSQKQSTKAQDQARRRELQIVNKIAAAEKTKTGELRKQTALLEKQARLQKAGGRGGGGGTGGGRAGGPAGDALTKVDEAGTLGGLTKSILGKAVLGVFGAITGLVASQVRAGYQTFVEGEKAQAPLAAATLDRAGFRTAATEGYEKYGYVRAETARQALDMARETGNIRDVSFAQMVSRSGAGVSQGGATDLMGSLTRAGVKGFEQTNAKGRREFENIIARGMTAGLDKSEAIGSMPEFVSGVERLIKRQGAVSAGTVTSMNVAKLLSFFGQSKQAGFQRSRGAEVLSKVDAAIRKPGGGAEGEAFMMRAFGFGTPGGTAGFMEARARMQQGVTGKGGVQNLVDMVTQAQREFGRGEASTFALEKVTGLSISQIETLKERVGALRGGGDKEAIGKEIKKFAEQATPMQEKFDVAATSEAGFAETVKQLSRLTQHLDDVGAQVFKPIHKIQIHTNRIVDELLPGAIGLLGVAGTVAKKSADTLVAIRIATEKMAGGPRSTRGRGIDAAPAPGTKIKSRFKELTEDAGMSDEGALKTILAEGNPGLSGKPFSMPKPDGPHVDVLTEAIEAATTKIALSAERMSTAAEIIAKQGEVTGSHIRTVATEGNQTRVLQSHEPTTVNSSFVPGTQ